MKVIRYILSVIITTVMYAQGPVVPGDPHWRTVGAGALSGLPTTCNPNRDVYICNGAGCTTNGSYYYCTATNTFTLASGGGAGSGSVTNVATGCGLTGGPITVTGTVSQSILVDPQTGSGAFAIPNGDCGKLVYRNQAAAVSDTIAQAGSGGNFANGWSVQYQCHGAGGCTVTPTTSTIDGGASLALTQNQGVLIVSDGTNYFTQRGVGGGSGGGGTVTVVASGSLTSTWCVTGGGTTTIQTPSTNCQVDSSGNLKAQSLTGSDTTHTGYLSISGLTSGSQGLTALDIAGTATLYVLPNATGSGNFLKDNGSVTCPTLPAGAPSNCESLIWATPGGGGTVTTTGSPASGNLSKFSGATSITNGDLSGDVTTSGTLVTTLATTAVTAGSYTNTNLTVDAKGRITAASNGTGGGGVNVPQVAGSVPGTSLTFGSGCTTGTPCYVQMQSAGFTNPYLTFTAGGTIGVGGSIGTHSGTVKAYVDPSSQALLVSYGGGNLANTDITFSLAAAVFDTGFTSTPPIGAAYCATITVTSGQFASFTSYPCANGEFIPTAGTNISLTSNGQNQTTINLAGTIAVGLGGTGDTTFTSNLPLIGNGTSAIAQGTVSGNTTKFVTESGSVTSGHCVQADASGNLVDSGSTNCGGGGATALSAVTAATGSNTIANGNNGAQVWNWAQTTNSQTAFTFGETTAATGTSDLELVVKTLAGSTAIPLSVINSLTGSQTLPALSITPTWNTSGVVDAGIFENVTNTASGTGSLLIDLQIGGTSEFKVDKTGAGTFGSSITAGSSGGVGGTITMPEGTAAAASASNDVCYGDSTLHGIKCSYNNGSFLDLPLLTGTLTAKGLAFTDATTTNLIDSSADFTITSHTLAGGASAILDMSAASVTGGDHLPSATGAAPTADGFIAFNTTTHALVTGSNGTTIVQAAAATGTNTSTACSGNNWVSTISSVAVPTCTQPTFASLAAGTVGAVGTFSGGNLFLGGVNAQTGTTYTILTTDANKLVTYSNAAPVAVTLPHATTTGFTAGAFFPQKNLGVGTVTITPTTSTINGVATLVLTTNQDATIYSDGTNYYATVDSGTGNTVTGGTCTNQVATAIAAITGVPTCTTVSTAYAGLTGNFVTSASSLTSTQLMTGAGSQSSQTNADWTIVTHTLTSGASGILDLHAASVTAGFLPPSGAGAAPTTAGVVAFDTTNNNLAIGNGSTTNHGVYITGSTPSAGVAHFAGSTYAATSSTVATADIAANAVTSAKMAVVNTRRVCDIPVGDTSSSAALTNAQLGPQKRICFIPFAATVVEMDVAADAGTPNVIVAVNHAGTPSNIVSSALATAASGGIACSNTGGTTGIDGATTCSSTLQNTSIAAGDYLELVSGTAGGTAKLMTIHVTYTIN